MPDRGQQYHIIVGETAVSYSVVPAYQVSLVWPKVPGKVRLPGTHPQLRHE